MGLASVDSRTFGILGFQLTGICGLVSIDSGTFGILGFQLAGR